MSLWLKQVHNLVSNFCFSVQTLTIHPVFNSLTQICTSMFFTDIESIEVQSKHFWNRPKYFVSDPNLIWTNKKTRQQCCGPKVKIFLNWIEFLTNCVPHHTAKLNWRVREHRLENNEIQFSKAPMHNKFVSPKLNWAQTHTAALMSAGLWSFYPDKFQDYSGL